MEMSKDPSYDQNIMCLENLIKLHLSYDKKSIWRASFFNDSSPLYSYSLKILILYHIVHMWHGCSKTGLSGWKVLAASVGIQLNCKVQIV